MSGGGALTLAGSGLIADTTGTIGGGTLEGSGSGELIVITPLSLAIGSVIANNSGATALTKSGSATLVLTGSNLYTGMTTVGNGTLQVGNGGSGASIGSTKSVLDNGTLVFNHADAVTFAPPISGVGNLVQAGTGVLTLTGTDVYSGNTTISAGTLQVGNGGSGATIGFTSGVLDNGSLMFNHNDVQTLSAAISGEGSLTQTGTGSLTLSGSNTYGGNTTISAGTLQVGNGGSGEFLGSPLVALSKSAAVAFNTFDSLVYSGSITGAGSLTQAGSGCVTLAGSNSYSGQTTISAGTLQVLSGAALGGTSGVADNATLVFNHSDAETFAQRISGTGNLVQAGTGVLTFTGSNTYGGNTTISAGTLQVGNGGSGASIGNGSDVYDYGSLIFNHSDSVSYSDWFFGTGSLLQAGSGILTLSGSNSLSGVTTISAGTLCLAGSAAMFGCTVNVGPGALQFASGITAPILGGLAGSGNIALATAASQAVTMNVGNNGQSTIYAGVLFGPGNLIKAGTGALTFSGSNTYSGATTINQGSLIVNGSLASPVTVNNGGTLGGTGTLTSGTVSAGGQIAPGNSLGTLTFSGGLVLASGADLNYDLDLPGTSSMISCSSLTLGGQQFSNFAFPYTANFAPGTYYLIESGSTPSGTLGSITSGEIGVYPATLAVQGNNLVLTVVPEPGTLALFGVGVGCLVGAGYVRRDSHRPKAASLVPVRGVEGSFKRGVY